jgi:acyl-[acyl-carrier-protein]-phospholipid O-acyltransferase/long-chain-fatty-acid--[acyl-carrier-protein] ligase
LPGSVFRIVDPDTLEPLPVGESGLILLGGSQIMKGYLNDPERTADAVIERDGLRWYKTGDKGYLDQDGFLTIIDRYSRFAKIGGEMISLSAVERAVQAELDQTDLVLAAVALPDSRKGEKIVLLLERDAEPETIQQQLRHSAIPPLYRPARIYSVPHIPLLGSGKMDLGLLKRLALELDGQSEA